MWQFDCKSRPRGHNDPDRSERAIFISDPRKNRPRGIIMQSVSAASRRFGKQIPRLPEARDYSCIRLKIISNNFWIQNRIASQSYLTSIPRA